MKTFVYEQKEKQRHGPFNESAKQLADENGAYAA
jgi:hypothetical protein